MIPVMVLLYYLPFDGHLIAAAGVLTVASLTDWLDGYLARKLEQTTPFGAFLDPVADKLIVAVALVLLAEAHASALLTVPALVIVGREFVVSALREWMAEMGGKASVAVSNMGKVKTFVQMVALIFLLANEPALDQPLVILGYVLLYAAAILTIWSMFVYLRIAWPMLSSGLKSE
jgi:CDP-diacylglycerol--glycerol-3-phosphate 3-phosphatidyltransferase|tara:strand:+ start:5181 stop:5705 length:525 start_codon:yes stop_codon:yes gene_type:complete